MGQRMHFAHTPRRRDLASAALLVLALQQLSSWQMGPTPSEAVSVQRLQVPDLVVIDQQQQQQQASLAQRPSLAPFRSNPFGSSQDANGTGRFGHQLPRVQLQEGPEAASLTTNGHNPLGPQQQQQPPAEDHKQVTFECLISFDRKKDRNLIVKWHHDERNEPIYQWIPELNKRSIAPQYRAFIAPITGELPPSPPPQNNSSPSAISTTQATSGPASWSANFAQQQANSTNQVQLLEAGFRLVRPTKELGGRYTCSAISSQNDDSKSKKMIVYTPPRSFKFNATRTDIGALLASQRDRLIQLTQPAPASLGPQAQTPQLPLAYRMRGLEAGQSAQPTTISPQMYSTIDYVNVNQQRAQSRAPAGYWSQPPATAANQRLPPQQQQVVGQASRTGARPRHGIKLVCDIDQVFPVPEVSIFRLAKLDGSHPEKLAKLETKIERDPYSGLFHVQVTSIVDDDELQTIRQNYLSAPLVSASLSSANELEIHFECLIALTNLELARYADNKRSIIYRPAAAPSGGQASGFLQQDFDPAAGRTRLEQMVSFGSSAAAGNCGPATLLLALCSAGLSLALVGLFHWRQALGESS